MVEFHYIGEGSICTQFGSKEREREEEEDRDFIIFKIHRSVQKDRDSVPTEQVHYIRR